MNYAKRAFSEPSATAWVTQGSCHLKGCCEGIDGGSFQVVAGLGNI